METHMKRKALYKVDAPVDAITRFDGEFDFLSNFYPHDMVIDGVTYPTVEHAFQALKTDDEGERNRVRESKSPYLAKRAGRQITMRDSWNDERFDVMERILRVKFAAPELAAKLRATGDRPLIEGNTWRDTTWGCVKDKDGDWRGQNRLGTALMEIREWLKATLPKV